MQGCRYDEIRSIQVIHLLSIWLSGGGEESKLLHKKLDEKIDNYAAGELDHAAGAISSIWDLARKNEALPSVPKSHKEFWQGPKVGRPKSGGWGMRTSLIRSMQEGSLLDRKYWVRRSRGGSMGSVYLPSIMFGLPPSRVETCE